ncbi:MAG: DegV family protein [Polyangiaceae bacterium]
MRLVTNPGSNLSARAIQYYQVHITPQKIAVDGEQFDTRQPIAFETLDQWVRQAKVFPHALGTSAAESAETFRGLLANDDELLVLTTSKKLVLTHTASVSAAKMLAPSHPKATIHVVDSGVTDVGAGLHVLLAGEAMRAGLDGKSIVRLLEAFSKGGRCAFSVTTLEHIVKGGKASFLKAWLADLMQVVPLLSVEAGEVKSVARLSRHEDRVQAMVDYAVKGISSDTPVWCAIAHANDSRGAADLADRLRSRLNVRYIVTRPFCATTYINIGPGGLGVFVYPLAGLPWEPTTPAVS